MYVIRADGNAQIGAGHVMRCLSVAGALAEHLGTAEKICFFCADEQSARLVESNGFTARVLGTDYKDMESELPLWGKLLAEMDSLHQGNHVILVDSYQTTDDYLKNLKKFGMVMMLDDMQEHTYPVDIVINYNVNADEECYRKLYRGTSTRFFLGCKYAPLRKQFMNRNYQIRPEVKDVLITTGGGDIDNIAGEMVRLIYREGIRFHVISGRYNPHLAELKKLETTLKGVQIYHDVADMAALMEKCDIAVTAGGSTLYELAGMGIPFLCFSYVRNQEELAKSMGEKGAGVFLGAWHLDRKAVEDSLQLSFDELCNNIQGRKACWTKGHEMVDGKGAFRIAALMSE